MWYPLRTHLPPLRRTEQPAAKTPVCTQQSPRATQETTRSQKDTLQWPAGHRGDPCFLPSPESQMHVTVITQEIHTEGYVRWSLVEVYYPNTETDSQGRAYCSPVLIAAFTFRGLTQVSSNFGTSVVTSTRWCHYMNPSMATETLGARNSGSTDKTQGPNMSHVTSYILQASISLSPPSNQSPSHKQAAAPHIHSPSWGSTSP